MIGQSGGRSARNRTARDANRRATQRERAKIDHPRPRPPLVWTDRARALVDYAMVSALGAFAGSVIGVYLTR